MMQLVSRSLLLLSVVASGASAFNVLPSFSSSPRGLKLVGGQQTCGRAAVATCRSLRADRSLFGLQMQASETSTEKAEKLADELREELPQLFDLSYTPKWDLYADKVVFMDPLNKFDGIGKYRDNIQLLKDSPLFTDGKMDLHECKVLDASTVETRWTLKMKFKAFPWQPNLIFTGTTTYTLDPTTGLVTNHQDYWDSIKDNQPVSFEAIQDLVGQLLPDVASVGIKAIKGGAEDAAPYSILRRYGGGYEVRDYPTFKVVRTPPGEVYDRDSYMNAQELLQQYRGDALSTAANSERKACPATEPSLQMDSGDQDSSLGYILPDGWSSAPTPSSKELSVESMGGCLIAVAKVRGFGSDRSRSEETIEASINGLRSILGAEGWQVAEEGKAFTLASYSDGYEIWLKVKPE